MAHPTKNDLMPDVRTKVCALLNEHLASGVVLATQAKQAHWNVRGPSFIALHKLFDDVNDKVREVNDEVAERVAALGGTALGDAKSALAASSVPDYPTDAVSGKAHVEALATGLAAFGKGLRTAIGESSELGDEGTADLFTGASREIDQMLWFVEAHNHATE